MAKTLIATLSQKAGDGLSRTSPGQVQILREGWRNAHPPGLIAWRSSGAAQPIATVQGQDTHADCTQLRAEIEANNVKLKQLSDEQGGKVAQNVAAGVAGIIIWPIWFGMDFKDAAGKEVAALQARQQYLTTLATERCNAPPPLQPAAPQPASRRRAAVPQQQQ
jgi:hypothetical protein